MPTAAEENVLALMSMTGMSEREATEKLKLRVAILDDGSAPAAKLAEHIRMLLERTLSVVSSDEVADVELGVGCPCRTAAPLRLKVSTTVGGAIFRKDDGHASVVVTLPDITRKVVACYAAAYVLARALGPLFSESDSPFNQVPEPFQFNFSALDLPVADVERPLVLDDAVLIGAGGVANGFLWAAEDLPLIGRLTIVDPKSVQPGNCNRCLYFMHDDVGLNKAKLLSDRFHRPGLVVKHFVGTFREYLQSVPDQKAKLVITTVDSRLARRSIQAELPAEVLDASTTDISEVVVHAHKQPTKGACLSCIYPHIVDEDQQAKHIADALGISVTEAKQQFIDAALAKKLSSNFPQFEAASLLNVALESLFKRLCGEQTLRSPGGQQIIAPFAFVSNLAGVLLALELVRRAAKDSRTNYMFVSPWMPPHAQLRRWRGQRPDCEFCADPASILAMKSVWPELFGSS